jgi:short-subunit dehydrogenase
MKMNKTALITGASSGIGLELARIHAGKGGDLVLVARRGDELDRIANELSERHSVNVDVLSADLTSNHGVEQVMSFLSEKGIDVHYLFNNAGVGGYGYFHERDLEKELNMIRLNIQSLVELTHRILPSMIKRGSGKILNTSSTAGFIPGPLQANYYATKAFVNSFSNALDQEVRRHGITVTSLCPGPVKTGFEDAAGMVGSGLFKNAATAHSTAMKGYKAMEKGRLEVITDGPLKFAIKGLFPFTPMRLVLKSVEKLQKIK